MFQISKVEKVTGLTRRQLQYWSNTGLIEPETCSDEELKLNLWSFQNLVALRITLDVLRQEILAKQEENAGI